MSTNATATHETPVRGRRGFSAASICRIEQRAPTPAHPTFLVSRTPSTGRAHIHECAGVQVCRCAGLHSGRGARCVAGATHLADCKGFDGLAVFLLCLAVVDEVSEAAARARGQRHDVHTQCQQTDTAWTCRPPHPAPPPPPQHREERGLERCKVRSSVTAVSASLCALFRFRRSAPDSFFSESGPCGHQTTRLATHARAFCHQGWIGKHVFCSVPAPGAPQDSAAARSTVVATAPKGTAAVVPTSVAPTSVGPFAVRISSTNASCSACSRRATLTARDGSVRVSPCARTSPSSWPVT